MIQREWLEKALNEVGGKKVSADSISTDIIWAMEDKGLYNHIKDIEAFRKDLVKILKKHTV